MLYYTISTPANKEVGLMNGDAKIIVSSDHKVYPAFQGEDGCVVIDSDLFDLDMPVEITQDIRKAMVWHGHNKEVAQDAADVLNARFDNCQFAVQEIQ